MVHRNVDREDAAEILERLEELVADGEVTAPAGFLARLQGAALVLRAAAEQTE